MTRYLTAQEAAAELGVSPATLYAYVSRGLVRSEESSGRTRRYYAEDIARLKARKEGRRNPEKVVENSLHWGTPILESALTLIADGRLYYRGMDALELAQTHTLEQVAALLWLNDLHAPLFEAVLWGEAPAGFGMLAAHTDPPLSLFEQFQAVLPLAAAADLAAYDLRQPAAAHTGARILRLLTTLAAPNANRGSVAHTLARVWSSHQAHAEGIVNAALILCADHELNVSSFTARCVASAGSTPYAVVQAGLAALQGTKHGGMTARVESFLQSIPSAEQVRPALAARIRQGEAIPGFGHRLYPDGDPRATLLLEMVLDACPDVPVLPIAQAIIQEADSLIHEQPTIDFALAVLSRALALPLGSALILFALGRTVGWIGHAIEQYQLDQLIRPRARYVGVQPGEITHD